MLIIYFLDFYSSDNLANFIISLTWILSFCREQFLSINLLCFNEIKWSLRILNIINKNLLRIFQFIKCQNSVLTYLLIFYRKFLFLYKNVRKYITKLFHYVHMCMNIYDCMFSNKLLKYAQLFYYFLVWLIYLLIDFLLTANLIYKMYGSFINQKFSKRFLCIKDDLDFVRLIWKMQKYLVLHEKIFVSWLRIWEYNPKQVTFFTYITWLQIVQSCNFNFSFLLKLHLNILIARIESRVIINV